MRRRLLLWLVSIALAATGILGASAPVRAAGDIIETGSTTYELLPDRGLFHVSVVLTLTNERPGFVVTSTSVAVEAEAGRLTATSDAGAVSQTAASGDTYYRYVTLRFPSLDYGRTRVVRVSYDIGGAPRSKSLFRAGRAYANLCIAGNGVDSGVVEVVLPKRYGFDVYAGSRLTATASAADSRTLTSGSITQPYLFWSCLEATDDAAFVRSSIHTGGASLEVEAWPEDRAWIQRVSGNVSADMPRLEQLIGLPLPSGRILVREAASQQLGDYAGVYQPADQTATVAEDADASTVAHELSHIWFNGSLFGDRWMNEGFATYAEKVAGAGNYSPCRDPGAYPGPGTADLPDWKFLGAKATTDDQKAVVWQYAAACYLLTTLADDIGPARLKTVLTAASRDEIAYVGAGRPERSPLAGPPVDARALLDLVDERGMVPAGVKDLDLGQRLFASFGILADRELQRERSAARAEYHQLAATLRWTMPLAVRAPMAGWDFAAAEQAMSTVNEIAAARVTLAKLDPTIELDGGKAETQFEAARDQAGLDAVLALVSAESSAATQVAAAETAVGAQRSFLGSIGLYGRDLHGPLDRATAALRAFQPALATGEANAILAAVSRADEDGLRRVSLAVAAVLAALVLVLIFAFVLRDRRRGAAATGVPGDASVSGGSAGSGGSDGSTGPDSPAGSGDPRVPAVLDSSGGSGGSGGSDGSAGPDSPAGSPIAGGSGSSGQTAPRTVASPTSETREPPPE